MDEVLKMSMKMETPTEDLSMEIDEVFGEGGTQDYEKLYHLPKLNGKTIKGNMQETDPTVPEWAKQPKKPTYSAAEVGAVDASNEISILKVKEIWDSVFKQEV